MFVCLFPHAGVALVDQKIIIITDHFHTMQFCTPKLTHCPLYVFSVCWPISLCFYNPRTSDMDSRILYVRTSPLCMCVYVYVRVHSWEYHTLQSEVKESCAACTEFDSGINPGVGARCSMYGSPIHLMTMPDHV